MHRVRVLYRSSRDRGCWSAISTRNHPVELVRQDNAGSIESGQNADEEQAGIADNPQNRGKIYLAAWVNKVVPFNTCAEKSAAGINPTTRKFFRSCPSVSKNTIVGGPKISKRCNRA